MQPRRGSHQNLTELAPDLGLPAFRIVRKMSVVRMSPRAWDLVITAPKD